MSSEVELTHPVQSAKRGWRQVVDIVGGPARMRVVAVLAGVLALDGADKGTVSATADNLEHAFHINNTDIGILVTVTTLVGAFATIPIGQMTDRVRRTRLLGWSIATWAVAMFFAGAAQSYWWLLIARLGLGAVTATAGPTLASLTGDFFPAKDRARMYGFILGGELIGTGFGFVVSGYLAAHLSWRYSFWWLMIPSALLVYFMVRLPEPARGGQSRLQEGQRDIPDERDVAEQSEAEQRRDEEEALREQQEGVAERVIEKKGIEPRRELVLTESPRNASLWWAVRYILRIRTDVVIIVASALGYFYFTGLRTFAIIFAQEHYHISKSTATSLVIIIGLGALAGVYLGGRGADRLMERGIVTGRVIVPAIVLLTISLFLAPAFWVTSLWIAIPLMTIGAGLLGSANPPQDAARLDIIHPELWGRSEGVRTSLRLLCESAAPVTFGFVSDNLFGGQVGFGGSTASGNGQQSGGLGYTFILFLVVLIAAGLIVLIAVRTYPRDVATASASLENTIAQSAETGRDPSAYPSEPATEASEASAASDASATSEASESASEAARSGSHRRAPATPARPTDRTPDP